jgi:hypothetical protein
MKANELCPPPHLEAADFPQETEVTIKSVSFAEVGEEKANKGIVLFEELTRGLVLNRTNLKRIIEWHGNETDAWAGKKITLYPSETEFGGRTVECIRVKVKK